MIPPTELQLLPHNLAVWHAYDRSVKADLFSTAVSTGEGTVLIDPIALDGPDLSQLQARAPITGIIVTNQNHWRAAVTLFEKLSVRIFAHPNAQFANGCPPFSPLTNGQRVKRRLEIIVVEGAAPGEIAIYSEADGGTLIVGDALINCEPYGFAFLPAKYCDDHRKMRQSLRQLIDREAKRILFAHGLPILSGAASRLRSLFDSE